MPKNMLEDIKPISRSPRTTSAISRPAPVRTPRAARKLPKEVPFVPKEPGQRSGNGLWYIAAVCIVALLFSLSFLFEHASVTIVPKSVAVTLDATNGFTAYKDSIDPEKIIYTVMTLDGEESVRLPSTETKTLSESAHGQVVIYNTYSTKPYSLVKSTRLETPDGKIYRIDTAVTIPGYKGSGANLVPGSVEVTATADVSGEAGNIGLVDFTIPGLAGTAQATKIYARSKTPMAGGVSGTVYTIPQSSADAAIGTLSDKLHASLLAKAKVQVPDGYLFYPDATVFTRGEGVHVPYSKDQEVPIALSGTLSAYLIEEKSLVHALAKEFVSQYEGELVSVPSASSFVIAPTNKIDPKNDTTFSFAFTGSGAVVWTVDTTAIQSALIGQKKTAFDSILATIPGIEEAEVVMKPFWKRSFPKNPERISVNVKTP